jgi:signal transduction histidine kinase
MTHKEKIKDCNSDPAGSYLILIVDDIPENVSLLGTILRRSGYKIAIAERGSQAFQAVKKSPPDLILLDIMMPDMDGMEVCRRLKCDHTTKDIPVIFLTAKIEAEDKINGFKVGGADYITKPFDPAEVVSRVNTHLNLKIANDTIRRHNEELERLLAERTRELIRSERQAAFAQFIQGIMHNLKNPLAAVKGYADLIERKRKKAGAFISRSSAPNDEIIKVFESMGEDIQSVKEIFDELVLMIDSMMIKSLIDKSEEIKFIDLNNLIRRELKFLEPNDVFNDSIHKNIELSVLPLDVEVVPGEIAQVIQNILHNSIDAVQGKSDASITVRSGRENNAIYFAVMDNGSGITEETMSRIFDPFFTTKPFANTDNRYWSSGIGLGLYMCSEIVKSYSGKIQVASVPGKETSFTVTLPMQKP